MQAAQSQAPSDASTTGPTSSSTMATTTIASSTGGVSLPPRRPLPRLPNDRPLYKLSVNLIETYKTINKVYYDEKAKRKALKPAPAQAQSSAADAAAYDDDSYDYIIRPDEMFYDGKYKIKEKIGKGSFGQVVRAIDQLTNKVRTRAHQKEPTNGKKVAPTYAPSLPPPPHTHTH